MGGAARPWLTGLIVPVLLGVAWEAGVRFGLIPGRLMPPPSVLWHSAVEMTRAGELQTHIAATLWRVLTGFGIGAAAGTVLGTLTGASQRARLLLDPTIQAVRAIPSLAWVPLFILWLGILFATPTRNIKSVGRRISKPRWRYWDFNWYVVILPKNKRKLVVVV